MYRPLFPPRVVRHRFSIKSDVSLVLSFSGTYTHRRDSGNSGDSERKPSTRPTSPKYTRSTRAGNDRLKPYEIGGVRDVKKTSSCMTSRLVRKCFVEMVFRLFLYCRVPYVYARSSVEPKTRDRDLNK